MRLETYQKQSEEVRRSSPPSAGKSHDDSPSLLHLQRDVGNQGVQLLFRSGFIQAKLAISNPDDPEEREADHVASTIMRKAAGAPCSCSPGEEMCEECQQRQSTPAIQRRATSPDASMHVPRVVSDVLRSAGHPLDSASRTFFEPRFGRDFSDVRIHTDSHAAESARSINAHAYAAGSDIAFAAGQYSPATDSGRSLLAHELTHVVQQTAAPTVTIQLQRKATKQDEEGKKLALEKHKKVQDKVAAMLVDARNIKLDPSKGPLDPDNLYHNTIELIDAGKILVSFLTPTHDSRTRKPPQLAYFDRRAKYPKLDGDYPADPAITDIGQGLSFAEADTAGETMAIRTGIPGFVSVFIQEDDLFDKDDLKKVLVHEAQHYADFHGPRLQDPALINPAQGGVPLEDWQKVLENYKSEFRAYWIQPVPPPVCAPGGGCLMRPDIESLASPDRKADNTDEVEVSNPSECTICPEPKPTPVPGKPAKAAPSKIKTNAKGKRQETILHYLMVHYKQQQFACCYVYDPRFYKEVNKFEVPASINLANSLRLVNLTIELEGMTPTMMRADVDKTQFADAVGKLDEIDWAFLHDRKMSAPFWELLKKTPAPLEKALSALAGKTKPSANDISDALGKALSKLK